MTFTKNAEVNTAQKTQQKTGYYGYRNFYGPGNFLYAIYPDDGWSKKWGPKPLLGHVYADDEFYAAREAHSKKLAPVNCTFSLMAIKQQERNK